MQTSKSFAIARALHAALFALMFLPFLAAHAQGTENTLQGTAAGNSITPTIERGKYLATAADCAACHTVNADKPFAGGAGIRTPFGTLFPPNITPDPDTGIGRWTDDEFYRALHEGVGRNGEHLYPAFPYDSYTQLSRDDVLAIKAYLFSLPPIASADQEHELSFPFNQRWLLWGWKLFNFKPGEFHPDPTKSDEINRGAYLAGALAHCSTCHTPRNLTSGTDFSLALAGSSLGGWYAPNITPDNVSGIGRWTDEDLLQYLSIGHVSGKGVAGGPMGEAVQRSFSHLPESDLKAIIAWLRDQKPINNTPSSRDDKDRARFQWGTTTDVTPALRSTLRDSDDFRPAEGARIYAGACASCHGMDGGGVAEANYPSLVGSTALGAANPDNVVMTILQGMDRDAQGLHATMYAFGQDLDDDEIATLANWLFKQFGRPSTQTTASHVADLRAGKLPTTPLGSIIKATGVAVIALALVALLGVFIRYWPRIKAFFAGLTRR